MIKNSFCVLCSTLNICSLEMNDYYPFGMSMPERSFTANSYRFGFNGKEKDDEVKGSSNQIDYGQRGYDSRLGRFLSVDPLFKEYPWNSTYVFAENRPIDAIDLDGLEKVIYLINFSANKVTRTKIELAKAGSLGNGAAIEFTKNGTSTNYYGNELKSSEEFTKSYEGNGGLVSYYVKDSKGKNSGNLTGGYGHELSSEEQKTYPEGTSIAEREADTWFSSDYLSKQKLVTDNLKVSDISETTKNALTDFAYNIKEASRRIGSFTKEDGGNFFLGYMKGQRGLTSRRLGESILATEGKYFHFNNLNKKQGNYLSKLLQKNTAPTKTNSNECDQECH